MDFNAYVGIPFAEKGRDRGGVDCWGLVKLFYTEQLGIDLPGYEDTYSDTTDKSVTKTIPTEAEKDWILISRGQEQPGDVVLMRIYGLPWHVGIVTGRRRLLHVEMGSNTIIERYDGIKWNKRILGYYRHRLCNRG